ncbi:putative baseplate assembly protein [Acrocarpospora macrocephala]|uniref:Putative baseplate assembly protein n=1 Tax=Acrocarpospora macrocephala TaxID=150177 RepID=A0A5M3WZR5_9ACTN|nr:putative baseplate assembly protein [Acrocarpospora macrocephala]GES11943.1 putative baseplate assembly protein [Acrocarpospora macrocephala]
MTPQECGHPRRRDLVRAAAGINGIDYLEVSPTDQRELSVHFLHPLPALTEDNFRIDGGTRVRGVAVEAVVSIAAEVIVLRTAVAGDFSAYTLRLVTSAVDPEPPAGFDPALAEVVFSFKVNCDSGLDCAVPGHRHPPPEPSPRLSYLAKDYASFRRLLLDRLSETIPDWTERSPADLGIVLVELLAYAGDHLSYFQDSVATEAYLGTARRRPSVRRHARLVGYPMHEGASARAWLVFETDADRAGPPRGTAVAADAEVVFETMHDVPMLTVSRNAIAFHTWSDSRCTLPVGATRATLLGDAAVLGLARGDVLVLEEVRGCASGLPQDADRTHRHPVRLASDPVGRLDPLTGEKVTDIRWHDDDALPFALCLAEFDDGAGGTVRAAVARANVALADHGLSVDVTLGPVPVEGVYRPELPGIGLTHAVPYERQGAASTQTRTDPRAALPAIRLSGEGELWEPRRDLLRSDRFAPEFVVEMEEDRRAVLRFGDGVLGRAPAPGTLFTARHRLGGGTTGNVGAGALARLVTPLPGVTVSNPLPAEGGRDPEPIRQVKLDAPQAFQVQERAVTAADYAAAAQRHPEVHRAAATRRWTGSWHTMFVTVDRRGGQPVDAAFEAALRRFLEPFRMAGYDLEIDGPRYVPLELALTVCARPHHVRQNVEAALVEAFARFFHPDNFTFGQPVYLSQVLARAAEVPGVDRIARVDAFHRYGQEPRGEIEQGFLRVHRLEIAQLDNDPGDPERGRLTVSVRGGL